MGRSEKADARGSVGTAADGLDLELRFGLPSAPLGDDLDLALFAGQIPVPLESVAVAEVERAGDLAIVGPVESAAAAAVEKASDLAIVVYDGSVRGDDVPPAVTESVAVAEVDKASDPAIVVYEGQADGDDAPPAVGELGVLATPDDEPQDEQVEAGQIIPAGSSGSTALTLCHLPLQQEGRHGAGVGERPAPEETRPPQAPAAELHRGEGPEQVGREPTARSLPPPGTRTRPPPRLPLPRRDHRVRLQPG